MKTFFNILQTVVNITNKKYPSDEFIETERCNLLEYNMIQKQIKFLINDIYYKDKLKQTNNKRCKLSSLNSILENTFFDNKLKEEIFDVFSTSQKHYFSFLRFINIYRLKKNPYVVTNDLLMNNLDSNHRNTFILNQNKSNYLFNINELITIIENAIGNSPDFFSVPLQPLNPYNNQPLLVSNLYNIYFKIKYNGRVLPLLFHCFFLESFNISAFSEQYESLIRENAIKKFIFNSPYIVLYNNVLSMIKNNIYTRKLLIHEEFPKELLVNIFRPFLFCNYMSNYYIKGARKVSKLKKMLNYKLKKFYEYNTSFGRKVVKLTKINNKIIDNESGFNTNHMSFYKISVGSKNQSNNLLSNNFVYTRNDNNTDSDYESSNEDESETEFEDDESVDIMIVYNDSL